MTQRLYELIFAAAEALEVPVVVLSLAALALVLLEAGALVTETGRHLRRRVADVDAAVAAAAAAVRRGQAVDADALVAAVGRERQMSTVLRRIADLAGDPAQETRTLKLLADFDFERQRRLVRSRLLVRWGPALGLMGTLIPLSPALEGLAAGDVQTLADNLRLAFSLTVLGLLVGAGAFTVALVRDRLYGQDYSDLEYVAAALSQAGSDSSSRTLDEQVLP